MEYDEVVVKESPGLCRCCLSEGCYKDLGTEYTWMSETEVYAEMLLECFDIGITQHNDGPNGPNRLICEVCITRLRDACNFKKQVLESEKKFIDMIGRGEFRPKVLIYQTQMKSEDITEEEDQVEETEVEYLEDDIDFVDADDEPLKSLANATISEVTDTRTPLRNKRGRPRKNPSSVKTEKKVKVDKEEKPKTSKAMTKDTEADAVPSDKTLEMQRKYDLRTLLTVVIENSTIMPFRWHANKFMCIYCCCPFNDSTTLQKHTKDEHQIAKVSKLKNIFKNLLNNTKIKLDISEISCKRCPKQLRSLEEFLDHAADVHDMKFKKDISRCLFTFKLSDDNLSCHECGEGFRFFGSLLKHAHTYHNKSNTFLCEICGQGFVDKKNVDSHVKNVHSHRHSQGQCGKCQKIFPDSKALKAHYDDIHRRKTFRCTKCPEVLDSQYLRKRHLAIVHDMKNFQFKCDICFRVFTLKSRLVLHNLRVHVKEKTFTCDICGFKVFSKDNLKLHMVRHDDSRPFQCDICKKAFQRKKTLEFHRRIHTNDKRYACTECGKAFVQWTSLKLHLRVHHSITKEQSSWS